MRPDAITPPGRPSFWIMYLVHFFTGHDFTSHREDRVVPCKHRCSCGANALYGYHKVKTLPFQPDQWEPNDVVTDSLADDADGWFERLVPRKDPGGDAAPHLQLPSLSDFEVTDPFDAPERFGTSTDIGAYIHRGPDFSKEPWKSGQGNLGSAVAFSTAAGVITGRVYDFERFSSATGKFHCEGCGALWPTVGHTSNCPRAAEDPREWAPRPIYYWSKPLETTEPAADDAAERTSLHAGPAGGRCPTCDHEYPVYIYCTQDQLPSGKCWIQVGEGEYREATNRELFAGIVKHFHGDAEKDRVRVDPAVREA